MPGSATSLVVIPAWNEEESLPGVLAAVRRHLPEADVLVVDDGSTDGTALVAREGGARVAELPVNLGVGGALRTGFRFALQRGYENVLQIDADGQHDPEAAPHLLARLGDADLVIGARFAGVGDYSARGPRRWAMAVLASALSRVARTHLTDTTSGFRAFGPRAVRLFAAEYPAEYLGDTIEALVLGARAGLVVEQVPVSMNARAGGRPSHGPIRATFSLLRALLALVFAVTRRRSTVPQVGTR